MLTALAEDGTRAQAYDVGRGKPILVLHPGMDDGSTWRRVGAHLATRFRVVIPHRRPYRLDLPASSSAATELEHTRAIVRAVGEPMLVVGHSSGAVAALEALVDMPSAFVGAVLYDPPLVADTLPFATASTPDQPGTIDRARSALASGHPGRAFGTFAREVLRLPPPVVWLSMFLAATLPRVRRLVPAQIEDAAAIEALGNRLDAYATIDVPSVLLTGERGAGDLHERLAALEERMRDPPRVTIPKQGHSANRHAPAAVAAVIERLADEVF
ncbi:alpha/beta hydrolase [Spiractinospora alimapuensis]|uniref:alpha/beta fold hydrolase n=1 Tax=Spiractinospora alimapuensis TaxID=2820884 RepID=UPI001F1DB0F9|nr:alpha/beta hydrolase [Spiractinospora alimapuensis]QVQ53971.1 alpha/beta hydrolase [Spiractinospora alimapuensis]